MFGPAFAPEGVAERRLGDEEHGDGAHRRADDHVGCAQPLVEQQSAADGQDRRPGHRQGRGQGVDGDVEGDGKAAVFDDKMHEHDAVLAQGLEGQVLPEAEGEEGDDAEDERRR